MNDILLDFVTGDLEIENGDFVIGNSDAQNIEQILLSSPSEWSEPKIGFQMQRYLNASPSQSERFVRELSIQLEDLEGMKINKIDISQGFNNAIIDAEY
ncbi:MAG: hypothetical protein EAZ27_04455 [Cytophagales bacterium]|nr:MAG: hypothetical protein EAZ27_04455 [Cytophagales bacterium]